MKQLKFSNRIKFWPVEIESSSPGGETAKYELREMKASVRDRYMDKMSARLQINAKGDVVGIKKFDGMQIDLVSQCLFDKDGKLVSDSTLKEWPSGTVADLFEAAQELNHLRKPSERNRIASEQVVKWLAGKGIDVPIDPEDIENVIVETDRKLFKEKDAEEEQQA
jgi:hypothetical protein